ncbi:putative deacetylase (putative secreted protein) [Janibacter sp. HTCC2649]|uniref:polysaccharide deacetylase family protein n=1 Tax=Janibacter sp. HTCC2649 TaxID=313589 RepID=UPI0000671A70|nr:polysaccharide deacetylase family protein [Janibacter sp. HTCC2649]EAP98022.1 putative deacetylase (putative secreted protein) [Janibacter sp. HTCC2649]
MTGKRLLGALAAGSAVVVAFGLGGGFSASSSWAGGKHDPDAGGQTQTQSQAQAQAQAKTQPQAKASPVATVAPGSMGLIALTFDDGPSEITPQLLEVLKKKNVKATFFLQGDHVAAHPELVRRIHDEGHVIGNHSWSHRPFDGLSDAEALREITRTNEAIRKITGVTPELFRYPQGVESESGNRAIRSLGMWGGVLWHWETDAGDYSCPGADGVQRYLNDNATDQALLLLHDGNEVVDCAQNQPKYLPRAIDSLRERGFEFGVVASAGGPSWVNQYSWVRVIPADATVPSRR